MSRYEGYESTSVIPRSVRIGTTALANSTIIENPNSHSYSSSGGGPMMFPNAALIGEERERHILLPSHHAHHSNFQSQSVSAPTPPQSTTNSNSVTSISTSNTASIQNQSFIGGALGQGQGQGQGLGVGLGADRISFHHSHFRSNIPDPIQFNNNQNIQIPISVNPNSTFYPSSFYDNSNTRSTDGSGSVSGSVSSVPSDPPSSVLHHHHHHQLSHPVMGFAVPGSGHMQSQSLPLTSNGSSVVGGGGGFGGSSANAIDGGNGNGNSAGTGSSAVGGGTSNVSNGQYGHGHGHGHGQQNGTETTANRLLNNPSRRASIQQHNNNNHLLNLHHHQSSVPLATQQPSSPQSLSPVGSFFNTNNNNALYSSFHSPFEADSVSHQYNPATNSSSDSSPQSYSHAPQSPLSFQSSNSNSSSNSNNTAVTSATPPSKSSSLRCTLWWGDLEPWMDEEYAKQVCSLMGWENVAVKVPHSNPDHVTGQQANNPGYCFLTFPSPQHAASVLAQVNNPPGGQPLIMPNSSKPFTLNWASSPSPGTSASPVSFNPVSAPNPTLLLPSSNNQQHHHQQQYQQSQQKEFSIFVGDLAPETSNSDLVAVFRNPVLGLRNDRAPKFIRPFLSCKSAKIMLDPATGVSRGYGFVRFTDEADQQRALIEMHGLYCLSRPMRISPATAKFKPVMNGVPAFPVQIEGSNFGVDQQVASSSQQSVPQQPQQQHQPQQQQQPQQQPQPQQSQPPQPSFVVTSAPGTANSVSTSGSGSSIATSSSSIPSLSSSSTASSVASSMPIGDLAAAAAAAAAANGQGPSLEVLAQILAKANISIEGTYGGNTSRNSAIPSITAPLVQDQAQSSSQAQQQQQAMQLQQQIQQMQMQGLMGMNMGVFPRYNFAATEEAWKHQAQARAILGNLIGPNGEQLTSTDPYNTTVFVGGLSPLISEETLRTFFAPFGDIHYVKVPLGKHCGFVQFVRKADAEKAIERMQGFPIGGSRIRLSWGRSQYKAAQAAAQAAMAAQVQATTPQPGQLQLSYEQAVELLKKLGLTTAGLPVTNNANGAGYMPNSAVDGNNSTFGDGMNGVNVTGPSITGAAGDSRRSMSAGGLNPNTDGERDRYGASAFSTNGPFSSTSPFGSRSSSVGPGEMRPLTQSHSTQLGISSALSHGTHTSTFSPFSPDPNFLAGLAADRHNTSSVPLGAGGESSSTGGSGGGGSATLSRVASSGSFVHRFGSGVIAGAQTSTNLAELAGSVGGLSGSSNVVSLKGDERRLSSDGSGTSSRPTPTPQQQTKYGPTSSSGDAFPGFTLNRSAPIFQLNRAPGSRPLSSQSNVSSQEDIASSQHLHAHSHSLSHSHSGLSLHHTSPLSSTNLSDSEAIQDLNGTLASLDLDHSANASPVALRSPGLPSMTTGMRSPGENSDSTGTASSGSVQFAV